MSKRQRPSDFKPRTLCVDPAAPDMALIHSAAEAIREGGLAVFPTRTLYGIGADVGQPEAIARVFSAKNRPPDQPIAILIGRAAQLGEFAAQVPESADRLMRAFWPGGLTLVFAARASVPQMLTGSTGKIGIRLPLHPVAAALLNILERPITGTSANISGQPGCSSIQNLSPRLMAEMAVVLDAGELAGGAGSTIVDVTLPRPSILREGTVPAAEIFRCLANP